MYHSCRSSYGSLSAAEAWIKSFVAAKNWTSHARVQAQYKHDPSKFFTIATHTVAIARNANGPTFDTVNEGNELKFHHVSR